MLSRVVTENLGAGIGQLEGDIRRAVLIQLDLRILQFAAGHNGLEDLIGVGQLGGSQLSLVGRAIVVGGADVDAILNVGERRIGR